MWRKKNLYLVDWPLVSLTQHKMIKVNVRNRVSWFCAPAAHIQYTATRLYSLTQLDDEQTHSNTHPLWCLSLLRKHNMRLRKRTAAVNQQCTHFNHHTDTCQMHQCLLLLPCFSHHVTWLKASTICLNPSVVKHGSLEHIHLSHSRLGVRIYI